MNLASSGQGPRQEAAAPEVWSSEAKRGTAAKHAGADEYLECRRDPSVRSRSRLARLGRSRTRCWCLKSALRFRPLAEGLLRAAALIPVLRGASSRTSEALGMAAGALEAAGGWDKLHAFFWKKLPVLVYHHVGPPVPGTFPFLTIPPRRFEGHLDWLLRHGFTAISPRDWLTWLARAGPLPERPVMITFDDGYEDITKHALPALSARGMPASVYIVTGLCGRVNSWDSAYVPGVHRLMDAAQIRFWSHRGIEMGCHTRTHRRLSNLTGAELEGEVIGSAGDLASILKRKVEWFSYPYGAYNAEAAGLVDCSFSLAVTTETGLNDLCTPHHLMRRANVDPGHERFDFPFLIWLGWGPFERAHAYLASRRQKIVGGFRNRIRKAPPPCRVA